MYRPESGLGEPFVEHFGEGRLHHAKGKAHALVRFEEGHRGVSLQEFRLGIDLDQDALAGRERIVRFHVAAAEAKVTDSGVRESSCSSRISASAENATLGSRRRSIGCMGVPFSGEGWVKQCYRGFREGWQETGRPVLSCNGGKLKRQASDNRREGRIGRETMLGSFGLCGG